MATTLYSVDSFHQMVREMIREAIKEQMVNELERLHLKELGGVIGTQETEFSEPTTGTSGTAETSGTKSGIQTQPGNKDVANNVLVPGSNMNINQGLQAAAKDPNFKKKAALVQKISDQIAGMKGVVIKEGKINVHDVWKTMQTLLQRTDNGYAPRIALLSSHLIEEPELDWGIANGWFQVGEYGNIGLTDKSRKVNDFTSFLVQTRMFHPSKNQ
jgi:hypothetical protein